MITVSIQVYSYTEQVKDRRYSSKEGRLNLSSMYIHQWKSDIPLELSEESSSVASTLGLERLLEKGSGIVSVTVSVGHSKDELKVE